MFRSIGFTYPGPKWSPKCDGVVHSSSTPTQVSLAEAYTSLEFSLHGEARDVYLLKSAARLFDVDLHRPAADVKKNNILVTHFKSVHVPLIILGILLTW